MTLLLTEYIKCGAVIESLTDDLGDIHPVLDREFFEFAAGWFMNWAPPGAMCRCSIAR
jgi:hypothetical protein